MNKPGSERIVEEFEQAVREEENQHYLLRLYVTGTTPRSIRAVADLKRFCEAHLSGRYELEVIDIYQQPSRAGEEQIIAAPTLVKRLPPPLRRLIGDLSNDEQLRISLGVKTKS